MFGAYSVLSVRARVLLVVVSVRRFSDKSTLYVGSYTVPCYTVCRILHCTLLRVWLHQIRFSNGNMVQVWHGQIDMLGLVNVHTAGARGCKPHYKYLRESHVLVTC